MNRQPNLFMYATSELSQDAFLCWLVEWSNPVYKDIDYGLHELSLQFLARIYELHHKIIPAIHEVRITRQFGGLDILIEINKTHAILIEDKIYTKEHSDQFKRYRKRVADYGYPMESQLPIHYKTGDQSDFSAVQDAQYIPLSRSQMITVLEYGVKMGIKNVIFLNYYEYLKKIENKYQAYRTSPVAQWEGMTWEGIYQFLRDSGFDGHYSYVANASGGFFAFWWGGKGHNQC